MTPRAPRVAVDGVLLLDKPGGITSQAALARAKRLFNAKKAGHTGTLDPMATGLLPIVFGEATKFGNTLLDAPKRYLATVRLGTTTTTGDLEGDVTSVSTCDDVDAARIESALARFRGEIEQIPPMYSALKRDGRPLYEYARRGVELDREARRVTISALEFRRYEGTDVTLEVGCSKGTYVRVLAEDIGKALGCGACLAALRRTGVGPFEVAEAVSLPDLEAAVAADRAARLRPVDAMLRGLPAVELDPARARSLLQGIEVSADAPAGAVRVYGPEGAFLGIAESAGTGSLKPRRLVATNAA